MDCARILAEHFAGNAKIMFARSALMATSFLVDHAKVTALLVPNQLMESVSVTPESYI